MARILNLTASDTTPDMAALGVVDNHDKQVVRTLLRFQEPPTSEVCENKAMLLANIALDENPDVVMVSAAPYFISHLVGAIEAVGLGVVYPYFTNTLNASRDDRTTKLVGFVGLPDLGIAA